MLNVDLQTDDLVTPRLQAILRALDDGPRRALLGRLGKELERTLQAHFVRRDREGNARGFPRSHFWSREVRAKTALRAFTADRATVGIDSPAFRQKLRGGTIRPGPGRRYLALPVRAEAYGVLPRAGTIEGLFFLRSKGSGKAWLARREDGALRVYWRLVRSVTQAADPEALPPIETLRAVLEARAETEYRRVVEQGRAL